MTTYKGFDVDKLSEEVNDKMDRDGANYEGNVLELWGGIKAQLVNNPVYAQDNVLYLIKDETIGSNADHIVDYQKPTAENNYTWFRLYESGWVEQGGICTSTGYQTIDLPITMENKNYSVQITSRRDSTTNLGEQTDQVLYPNCTVSSIYVYINDNTNNGIYYEVKGVKASS